MPVEDATKEIDTAKVEFEWRKNTAHHKVGGARRPQSSAMEGE